MKTKQLLLSLFALVLFAKSYAQAPFGIPYQAAARKADGQALTNTAIKVRFSILDSIATGTVVFKETHSTATNALGMLNLNVGMGNAITGTLAGVNWGNNAKFLQVELDTTATGNNYSFMGVQQLMSVPYALFAANNTPGPQGPQGLTGAAGSSGWGLTGSTGMVDNINFIGTTDSAAFNVRVNNQKAGRIDMLLTNSFWGYLAGNANTSGFSNTANGAYSLNSNTTGQSNTANGAGALAFNTIGYRNTANGFEALKFNTTGDHNTASGVYALASNYTGSANTANGGFAMYSNTNGLMNTANGFYSLHFNSTGNYNTANGSGAMVSNTVGNNNTANGYLALYSSTIGDYNTAIGDSAMYLSTTGSNNTVLGHNAQTPSASGSNQVRIGNTSVAYAGVQVAWTITSDKRWKSNIRNSNLGLSFIGKLRPVSYYRNNDESKKLEYGFIAQELEDALNDEGVTNNGIILKDDAGMYGVRYNDLIAPMVKAIQEQQLMIENLKKQNVLMQKQIDELKKRP